MEEINLNFDEPEELESINLGGLDLPSSNQKTNITSTSQPSINSGGGLELLMNEKRKDNIGKSSSSNNLDNDLENEITEMDNNISNNGIFDLKKDVPTSEDIIEEEITEKENNENIGISTIKIADNSNKVTSTWDGYKPINKVINESEDDKPVLTKEEMLKEKFNILRKLENLERRGVQLTKKYSMDSNLMEMKGEYENIVSEKEKKNSVKFQGKVLTALITGIEFLNSRFDPFDLKLDGWSEQLNENLEDYDDIFGELYEKYKSKASMSPEMKLIFQLAASGMMIHMTNTMFKSAIPGMDDIMRQNPDLMQQFTSAAMNSMNQSNPGVSKFMNEFSNTPQPRQNQQPVSGNSFMRENPQDILPPKQPPRRQAQPPRQEMKGPTNDISNLLSGLKKKPNIEEENMLNDSIISLEDMNNLEKPKRSRRKKGSEKNTLSLDI